MFFKVKIYNAVAEVASPYLKQAGEMIQRLARPLLNTKFGKVVVAGWETTQMLAVEGAYKLLEGAEWVIEKGAQGINYVGKKATDLVNWIGDTTLVQKAIQTTKEIGSWIGSTSIFKSAVEMTISMFNRMSNFVTAVVESYKYYNQSRTIARRIVSENHDLVDEHVLLKTFQNVSIQEEKKSNQNLREDDVSFTFFFFKF